MYYRIQSINKISVYSAILSPIFYVDRCGGLHMQQKRRGLKGMESVESDSE